MAHFKNQPALVSAKLAYLVSTSKTAIYASLVIAAVLAYMMIGSIDNGVIAFWLALIYLLGIVRIAYFSKFTLVSVGEMNVKSQLIIFRAGVLASGLSWGSAGFLLFPSHDAQLQLFLIFVLLGLSSGIAIPYAADRISSIAFSGLVVFPLIIRLIIEGDNISNVMAILCLLYLAYLFIAITFIHKKIFENFSLQFQASEQEQTVKSIALHHQSILDRSMNGFWLTDLQGRLLQVNETYCAMSGYSESELLNMRIHDIDAIESADAMNQQILSIINKGEDRFNTIHRHKSGRVFQVEVSVQYTEVDGGRLVIFIQDITERMATQQHLIESEYRWKFAVEGTGDGVWDVNVQTNEANYSKRWSEMLGYEQNEILPSRDEWRALIHPDDKARVLAAGSAYMDGATDVYIVEYRIKCKNGTYKWMLSRGMVVSRTDDGKVLRMIGTQIDITERKTQEEKLLLAQSALAESRDRYLDLYEFAPVGYLSVSQHGIITEVNWKVTSMFGLHRKKINQHRFEAFIADDDKGLWQREFANMKHLEAGEEVNFDIKLMREDAQFFIANLNCLRMDNEEDKPMLRISLIDVTQIKQAELDLQAREGYQRALLDNFPFLVWLKDKKHHFLAVNQTFASAANHATPTMLIGKSDTDVWSRDLAIAYRADDREVMNSGLTKNSEELLEVNGSQIWFETYKSPLKVDGKVIGTVGFARNIDERKHAEKYEQFRSTILELLAENIALPRILEAIVLEVEKFNSEMICSILLLDTKGKRLVMATAPNLPPFYNAVVDGLEIGLGVGSCGTAAFTGERVIVEDIATHPYWAAYTELAANSGIGACWSQPILSLSGYVLGTFAVYHRQKHTPTEFDLALIKQSARLASIAIERAQAESELRIAAIAFESQEGMMVTDANNVILKVNKAFSLITGYSVDEAIGQTPRLLSSGEHDEGFYTEMWASVYNTGHWAGEVFNRRKNGEVYPQHLTITVVKNSDGTVSNHVVNITDITMNKAAAEEIQSLAFYDPLTHLPNRRLLVDRLNQALVASARSGREGAVLFLDLDHFKTLNDSLGHDIGDLLLQQVAERLTSCVREGDTVARLGGDEYVVLLEELSDDLLVAAAQAEEISEKILAVLNQPYQLASHEYQSTPSIGVALFNNHNQSQEELLKHADIAMYQAKKAGRNAIRFFDPKMQDIILARVDLERELRKALEKNQLHLYYQIQVSDNGCPMGAEALIRWIHPERGLVSPFNFIPLAEETGLILSIGQWVLETACAQLKAWQQKPLTRHLTLSINVSAKQFHQADFVLQVQSAVEYYAIDPMKLKLELTESMLLDNVDATIARMNALKDVGIRFSLDDFGTGYSSLQYLKRLPLYQLKIDQSFVRDIAVDSSDQAIVRTIVAMAHTLNLNVIAEGVETEEQQDLLLSNGCTHYQGYFFGKPVAIEQFEATLKLLAKT